MENELSVLDIANDTNYWFVRANGQSQFYDDFKYNNFIAIDSNNFPLEKLFEIPSTLRSSADALRERYKQLFAEHDLKLLNEKIKDEDLTDEEIKEKRTIELRRSSNRSNRNFHFVEEMNINDFVIVPFKSSEKFLIGVVTSDCFTSPIKHMELLDDDGNYSYDICNFPLKRRVLWIKELPQKQFPDSLSWIKTAHQSIFNITEYANTLNPYIFPIYKYKDQLYFRIGVNTTNQISSSSWLDYQLLLKEITEEHLDDLFQKQKVQSPGDIVIYVIQKYWWLIPLVMSCLFGEVEINHGSFKMKFQGIIKFFSKDEKLKRKLSVEQTKVELDQKKADLSKRDIETLKQIKEIKDGKTNKDIDEATSYIAKAIRERAQKNQQKIDESFTQSEEEKNIPTPSKDVSEDAKKVVNLFKLSDENPGSLIQYESQSDSLTAPEEESDKKKEK